jgi:hypothetical protein
MRLAVLLLAALLVAVSAPAARAQQPSILGGWSGVDGRGVKQTLEFREDGKATWRLEMPQGGMSLDIRYAYDAASSPKRLDLFGFESGPLAGRTLYGIVEFTTEGALRFDCEPGGPGDGDKVRPAAFTEQTVTYERVTR